VKAFGLWWSPAPAPPLACRLAPPSAGSRWSRSPSPGGAPRWRRCARAAARITVEVGPTAARSLYLEPLAVDELWLAAYLGVPPEEVVGEELLAADRLAALLEPCAPAFEVEEASGRWRFERLRPVRPRPA
jgi:hypothetical protein